MLIDQIKKRVKGHFYSLQLPSLNTQNKYILKQQHEMCVMFVVTYLVFLTGLLLQGIQTLDPTTLQSM